MQLWQDGVVALLAAIGLASLVWTAVRAVLFAGPERRREIGLVLPAQGDGERLEELLRLGREAKEHIDALNPDQPSE